MRELEKPIGRVFRRLRVQRFLAAAVWSWGAALAVVAVVIAVEKGVGRSLPGPDWLPFAIAGGVGLVVAALIALVSGPTRVDAAVAIDRVFHLNERLSTALTLPGDLRETPAGRALVADAIKHVSALDIGAEFAPRLPRRAWVPLIPAALALALVFVPEWTQSRASARSTGKLDKGVISSQTKALGKKISSQRKDLDKSKFTEADKLLAEIEKAADNLAKAPSAQKDQALVELNKLSDALKEREKQLGSPEQIRRQLQQLKEMASTGPADDFARDLAKGDFQKAAEELKKLQEKLMSGKMNQADQKALKEQVAEMAKQLQKLANLDERKKQLEEARKNGGLTKEQFEREMAKLDDQAKNLQKLQKLAGQLAQAQQQMEKGDMQKAAQAMAKGQQQLTEMAQQLQELESLDGALADLQDAKNGMTGDQLNQLGESLGQFGRDQNGRTGQNGLGRGRGRGDRPEAPDSTALYNTKVAQQFKKGKAVVEGTSPFNKAIKGQSIIDVQGELEVSEGLSAEALTNQKIPKNVEKHIRGYFDQINKGR
ncbi:MAG: hypothetical protein QOE66_995 [Chloroflexota bacterium]|nr:hypothetical protein [Chloroflexota bacterium]